MDASRWRSPILLTALLLSLAPAGSRADPLPPIPEDFQPNEPAVSAPFDLSAVPALVATFFYFPPITTVVEEVKPVETPTVVVSTPPTPQAPIVVNTPNPTLPTPWTGVDTWGGITMPGSPLGPTMQGYDTWNPTVPEPTIVNINKVPEPASLLSGLLGVGLALYYRRRRPRNDV